MEVVRYPDKRLLVPCKLVTVFDDALIKFASEMHITMEASGGVGLAANQVGDSRSMFTLSLREQGQKLTLVNPVITKMQGKVRFNEGCLSFPETFELVERADEVWVESMTVEGKPQNFRASGIFAICVQHEVDHLLGKTFLDRMSRLKANIIRRKLSKVAPRKFDDDIEVAPSDFTPTKT